MDSQLEKSVKESEWKKPAKESFKYCLKEAPNFYEDIQKKMNFTKEQCDMKYDILTTCMFISMFVVSFKIEVSHYSSFFFLIEMSYSGMDF